MLPSLQQAIAAIKAGNKKQGRALLADILQADYDNEAAWLWLSSVVETDAEKRRCLKRVLDINPDNAHARKGLALLGPEPDTSPAVVATNDIPLDEPEPDQEKPAAPPQPSLKERLAALPPPLVDTEVDIAVLEKAKIEQFPAAEPPPAGAPADDAHAADDIEPDDRDELDEDFAADRPEPDETGNGDDDTGQDSIEPDDEEWAEAEEDEAPQAAAAPSFWQTERAAWFLGGLVVFLLLCVACMVAGLVLRPVIIQLPATVDAAVGTATPTPTSTATATFTPTPTSTFTPTPTITSSPTATPVVADTATPTPTLTRTPTPERGGNSGQVIDVLAPDEITVAIGAETVRVKYLSIVPPGPGEPFNPEALAANQQLVQGQTVRLERDRSNTDANGALLRYVYVGDVQVNEALVQQGLARVELVPPDTKYGAQLQAAEQDARLNRRGLWSLE